MQFVMNAAKIAKYPSSRAARSRYTAVIVLTKKGTKAVIQDNQTGEIIQDQGLKKGAPFHLQLMLLEAQVAR